MTTTDLDLRGLKCPAPLVQLNDAIATLETGAELAAVADDRAFEPDVRAWCELTGHTLVNIETGADEIRAVIRKEA